MDGVICTLATAFFPKYASTDILIVTPDNNYQELDWDNDLLGIYVYNNNIVTYVTSMQTMNKHAVLTCSKLSPLELLATEHDITKDHVT